MKSKRVGILSATMLIVGALALMVFRWPFASEAVYPVERLVRLVIWPVRFFRSAVECERLQREVEALSLVRGDLERQRVENDRLRRALDYRVRRLETWIAAEVLSRGGGVAAAHDAICVDKGSLSGVKVGAIVVVPEGLVGRVTAVSPHTAEITLLTDSSIKVSCEVESDSAGRIFGILSGGESGRLCLRHLEHAERAEPHSRVITSGLGGVFPHGFEVGTLNFVTNGVRGIEGEVLPRVDYSTLEDVFIRRDQ